MKIFLPKTILTLIISISFSITNISSAQSTDNNQEDRQQLLSVLSIIEKSLNDKNIDNIKKYIHPNAVVTFHDATTAKGIDAIEDYFQDKLGSSTPVLKSYSTKASVDGPADFYGNMAVAYGSSIDSFVFITGNEFELESKWTVTLNKNNGNWSIVALHFSINLFDNPLLNGVKNNVILFSLLSFLGGLLIMFLLLKILKRKSVTH